jgi:hypothetical protein
MAGGLNAHTNPFVEAWGYKREHIEKTFRFTPKALGIIAVTGVLFPLWVYKVSIREFVRARVRNSCRARRALAACCGGRGRGDSVVGAAPSLRVRA